MKKKESIKKEDGIKIETRPLTPTELGIIKIIKSAIKGTKEALPDGFNDAIAKTIILNHSIEGLVYYGLKNMDLPIPSWLEIEFAKELIYLNNLHKEAKKIMDAFDSASIEYIPLKGIKTKDLYPSIYMRHMSDVDILIHTEDYKTKIKPIMISLDFTKGTESDHELHWSKEGVMIELHKRIIPSYNIDYYKVIGDGWEWLKTHSDFEYNFIHFAKHYRDSGIGISHLVEMEVTYNEIDLEEIGLEEFKTNIKSTLDYWFRDKESNPKVDLINNVIFSSNEYGLEENSVASQDLKRVLAENGNVKKANLKYKLNVMFPSWDTMSNMFPILKKFPILLPFVWIYRCIRSVFKGNMKTLTKNVTINENYQNQLKMVGLEYNL